jgi:4-amino-4-deoxy-L-arabinose transferase-like glycosyltransferase
MEGSIILGVFGLSALLIVTWIFLYVRHEPIADVIIFSYLVRCVALVMHRLIIPSLYTERLYPFERLGWEWSSKGVDFVLSSFTFGPDFYTWLISLVYLVFPRSSLLISSINIFLGSITVYVVYKIVLSYSSYRFARLGALLAALFPVLVLQTIILSREMLITSLVSASCLFLVKFSKSSKYKYFLYGVLCLIGASAPHTGVFLSALAAFLIVSLSVSISKAKVLYNMGLKTEFSKVGMYASVFIVVVASVTVLGFQSLSGPLSGAKISKLLTANDPLNPVYARYDVYSGGAADFPNWISPPSPALMVLFIPLRVIYFLFSPFVWMISNVKHVFGFINALAILFITYNSVHFFSDRYRVSSASLFFILCLVISFVVVFSMATNNFGQAFRHRSKILPLLIAFGVSGYGTRRD